LRRQHLGRQPLPPGRNNRPGPRRRRRRGLTPVRRLPRLTVPAHGFTPVLPHLADPPARDQPLVPLRLRRLQLGPQLLHPPPGRTLPLLQPPQHRHHHAPPARRLHGRTGPTSPTPKLCLTSTNPASHSVSRSPLNQSATYPPFRLPPDEAHTAAGRNP